jgi:hypothetical protein
MATGIVFDDAPARASDALQAAYFRGALVDQREVVAAELARNTHALDSLTTKTDSVAISRLRRDIRIAAAECRELDRMIAALDSRFAPAWSDRG